MNHSIEDEQALQAALSDVGMATETALRLIECLGLGEKGLKNPCRPSF